MNMMILETARKKFLSGETMLADSFYERAVDEGIPYSIVTLNQITKGYIVFPLEHSAELFFEHFENMRNHAKECEEFRKEYKKAIVFLTDIKTMFLRSVSLYYFSELAVCYQDSIIVKHIHELYKYLDENMQRIIYEDCFEVGSYAGSQNLKKLEAELMQVKVFALNILLSYTAVQNSAHSGTTYYARTYDFGSFASTDISKSENYTNWATVMPRLNILGLEAYYDVYLNAYNDERRKFREFDSPKELKDGIIRQMKKNTRHSSGLDFFKYAKMFAKDDLGRSSYFKETRDFAKYFNPFIWLGTALNERGKIYGIEQVGSFELDVYFTRKKLFGVCDMISCGTHWNIETVRTLFLLAGCCIIGVPIYLILALAMKVGLYIPGVSVVKH